METMMPAPAKHPPTLATVYAWDTKAPRRVREPSAKAPVAVGSVANCT